jgi:hypothetical protein
MAFESVRAYVQLASGLTELTRARAMEAAQGLLSLPATGIATGTKMASQASALADELFAAAASNRSNLTALVRTEVDAAIMTRLGLVSAQKLEEAEAEAARLRSENARLLSAVSQAAAPTGTAKKAASPRGTAKKAASPRGTAKKAASPRGAAKKAASPKGAAKTATTAKSSTPRSAVTTRTTPAAT